MSGPASGLAGSGGEGAPPPREPPLRSLRRQVHRYLEETPDSPGPRIVQTGVMGIILLSVAAVVIGTIQVESGGRVLLADGRPVTLEDHLSTLFGAIEWFSVGVFTIEYLLRLWSCTVDPRYARPIAGRIRFALSPMSLIDLLAILPSYFQAGGFIAVRALRLVRIFRIFKLGHYSKAVRSLQKVLAARKAELGVTVFLIAILLALASTVVYYIEHDGSPDNKFTSIPATMWWSIVTLTTVGYGDISPQTPLGKLVGGICAIFGIGLVALPAAILGSAFIQELGGGDEKAEKGGKAEEKKSRCPHSGKGIG